MTKFLRIGAALALLGCAAPAAAGVQVMGTRVIYPEAQREVTVHVRNGESGPRLLQAWVDDGDSSVTAENSMTPFVVTPPISRIDPNKGQALRLIRTGGDLPDDRESVFWLNVLEIPPRPKAGESEGQNILQFAVRTRLKIFYRPRQLTGDPADAYKSVTWRVLPRPGGEVVECVNDSVYSVSFSSIVGENGSVLVDGGMCPAKGNAEFPAKPGLSAGSQVMVNVINDYGGVDQRDATVGA